MDLASIILLAIGVWACSSDSPAGIEDADIKDASPDGEPKDVDGPQNDGAEGPKPDRYLADGPEPPPDTMVDQYVDGARDSGIDVEIDSGLDAGIDSGVEGGVDGGTDSNDGGGIIVRPGINDYYAPLPFCSGRNIFMIKEGGGVGFCAEAPTLLYRFPISADLASVTGEPIVDLPSEIGGRVVVPTTIREGGPGRVILPMMNPIADTATTFLMVDISSGEFLGPQVNATGLQIGTNPIGDPIPISGLYDLALLNGEFWGVLSNPNPDGTYRFGFGIALPQTVEGLVDVGVEPNEAGVVERILSNRIEEIEMGAGTHFSFQTTHQKPTNVEELGGGLFAIQDSGTADEPASIDIASQVTHQLLEGRSVSLGMKELTVLPRLAVDLSSMKVYPVTATSLWEVDLMEGAPSEQENEMPLAENLAGPIAGAVVLGGQMIVGDSDGQVLFVDLSEASWGTVAKTIDVGSNLTWVAADASGHLFVAVGATLAETTPHIISINPSLLD